MKENKTISQPMMGMAKDFVEKSKYIHKDKFDYSLVSYTNRTTEVEIICPTHGIFNQTPKNHIRSQTGCIHCSIDNRGKEKISTLSNFIKKAVEKHGNRYDYSKVEYIKSKFKVKIICKEHGEFLQTPKAHLQATVGCPKCGYHQEQLKSNTEEFVQKAKDVHGEKYDYSKTTYVTSRKYVNILCKKHGVFEQNAAQHLHGHGCPICGQQSHWKRSNYIKKANGRICTFYIIKCFNENEEFYKIGITVTELKRRYSDIKRMPYNYEIVSEVFGEAGYIWDLELEQKRKLKEFNYQPNIKFAGSKTECFTQYKVDAKEK